MRKRSAHQVALGLSLLIATTGGCNGCGWGGDGWGGDGGGGGGGGHNSTPVGEDRNARAGDGAPGGDSATRIVYLQQNWTPEESQRFYFTSQGSQIVPYDWFLALETAEDETLLR